LNTEADRTIHIHPSKCWHPLWHHVPTGSSMFVPVGMCWK